MLDVGTASGFLSFAAEQAGAAEVVSFDATSGSARQLIPFPEVRKDPKHFADYLDEEMDRMKRSYWYSHQRLGSRAKAYYGDIYNIGPDLGTFDIAIVAQILVHLKHPIFALEQIASVTAGTLIITEGFLQSEDPIIRFLGQVDRSDNKHTWWHCSSSFFKNFLEILGFKLIDVTDNTYKNVVHGREPRLSTLVFRRIEL